MTSPRTARVGEQIRHDIADLLTVAVRDPAIGFITITRVTVTPDLQQARVYYTIIGDEKARRETAREIQAVAFFRVASTGAVRVSMRSKYDVDVRRVANEFGGGGHKNAAGFSVTEPLPLVRPRILELLVQAIAEGLQSRPA